MSTRERPSCARSQVQFTPWTSDLHKGAMNNMVSQEDMAKLTKHAKTGIIKEVGLLKCANGDTAKSPEASLNSLCNTHFHGSRKIRDINIKESIARTDSSKGVIKPTDYEWNTVERLKKANSSFSNSKTPGLDGITPNS